jgi:hypothetical protein
LGIAVESTYIQCKQYGPPQLGMSGRWYLIALQMPRFEVLDRFGELSSPTIPALV